MKLYEKCFSGLLITILFMCVFFRIESWPFSDWRMYEYATKPEFVRQFIVKAKIDGKTVEPYTGKSYGLKVDAQLRILTNKKDTPGIESFCNEVHLTVSKTQSPEQVWIEEVSVDEKMNFQFKEVCRRN